MQGGLDAFFPDGFKCAKFLGIRRPRSTLNSRTCPRDILVVLSWLYFIVDRPFGPRKRIFSLQCPASERQSPGP